MAIQRMPYLPTPNHRGNVVTSAFFGAMLGRWAAALIVGVGRLSVVRRGRWFLYPCAFACVRLGGFVMGVCWRG